MNRFSYSIFLTAITLLVSPSISLSADCEEGWSGFMRGLGLTWGADFDKGVTAYENGDYESALCHWVPLAEKGDADAQFGLGHSHFFDKGVLQDFEVAPEKVTFSHCDGQARQGCVAAVKWYTLAAEQGHAGAQYFLGLMYQRGLGVSRDEKVGEKWNTSAAELGNAYAQYKLGNNLRRGEAVKIDRPEGFVGIFLSLRYINQEYEAAMKWYTLAAEQGHARAQNALGAGYANGRGVPKDLVYAYMWLNLGSRTRFGVEMNNWGPEYRSLDTVAKEMTREDISTAQKLSRECLKKDFKEC